MPIIGRAPDVFKQQADAVLDQASPTANYLYTVLDTIHNARIESAVASVTWTVQPNPLEIILTMDGQSYYFTGANPTSGSPYALIQSIQNAYASQILQVLNNTLSATVLLHQPIEARSIKIQARTGLTTAGTVSNLFSRVKYAKIP